MRPIIGLTLLAAALGACGGGEPPPAGGAPAVPEEVTVTVGISDTIATLDPLFQTRALDGAIIQQIMEPLVWYNDDLELIPWLATSWESPDSGQTWIFHLKEGVQFHDGTPFNAEAVVAHFLRIRDTPGSTRRGRIQNEQVNLEHIVAVDEHTVRFELDAPFARWPELMRDPFAHIVSPTAAAEHGDGFTRDPVGTGPFVFDEWRPGVRLALRRNPDWHGGEITFDRLVFRPIPEQQTRMIELLQGNLDLATINWAIIPDYQDHADLEIQTAPSLSVRYFAFNTQKPPFADARVRQAANLAVNKGEIVEYLLNGLASVSVSPLPEALPDFNPDVTPYDYDPDRARELLAEAGYPDGVDVVMWSSTRNDFSLMAQAVAEDLRQVGIRVETRVFDQATYFDHFDRYMKPDGTWEPQGEGVYDMAITGWVGGESPFGFLWDLFRTSSYENGAFYSSPRVDGLLGEMLRATDPADYSALVREVQEVIVADAPWLFCTHAVEAIALRRWVEGYRISLSGEFRFGGVRLTR